MSINALFDKRVQEAGEKLLEFLTANIKSGADFAVWAYAIHKMEAGMRETIIEETEKLLASHKH